MHPFEICDIIKKLINQKKNLQAYIAIGAGRIAHNIRFPTHPKPGVYIYPGRYTASDDDAGRVGTFSFKIVIHRDNKTDEGFEVYKKFKSDYDKIIEAISLEGHDILTGNVQLKSMEMKLEDMENNSYFYTYELNFEVDCSLD